MSYGTSIYRRGGEIIKAGDMSGNITSDIVDIQKTLFVGLQLTAASATHVGTITVQVSNDRTNWFNVVFDDGTSTIVVSNGSAVATFVNLADLASQWMQVVYTATSGVGSLNCLCVLKLHQ